MSSKPDPTGAGLRTTLLLVAVAVLVIAGLGVPGATVAAQQESNTTTSTPTPTATPTPTYEPPGPFGIDTLSTNGVLPAGAPERLDSIREVPNPDTPKGQIAVRYQPVSPLKGGWKYPDAGETVENDRLQLYSPGLYESDLYGEYQVVIVYWDEKTVQTPNGTQTIAANQEVQRVSVNLSEGYNHIEVTLRSHYDDPKRVTMWLERDGEPLDGARWTFGHRSNPLTAAPGFAINSKGDLWRWGLTFIVGPALPGLFIARQFVDWYNDQAVTSFRKGTIWWTGLLLIIVLVAGAAATWQTAAVLARAPFIAGVFMFVSSTIVMLGLRDPDLETAIFVRKNLSEATPVDATDTDADGKTTKHAIREEIDIREVVRRDGNIYLPAQGIRPGLARIWSSPAQVDESDHATVVEADGDASKKYEVDPLADDEMLVHTPAHLAFEPTVVEDRPEGETAPSGLGASVRDWLARINWEYVGGSAISFGVIYTLVDATIGVPSLGVLLGLLPAIVMGTVAKDGRLEVEFAPYHFNDGRVNQRARQETYTTARTFSELQSQVADIELEAVERVEEFKDAVRSEMRQRFNRIHGATSDGEDESSPGSPTLGSEPDEGVAGDD